MKPEIWISPVGNVFWMVEYMGDEVIFDTKEEAEEFIMEVEE